MTQTNLIEDLRLLAPPSYSWLWGLVVTVALVLAILLALRAARRGPTPPTDATPGPSLWELALAELELLAPLLCPEHSRDYGIRSTGVLRRYIECRYLLPAPRLATEEFLISAGTSPALPVDHRASLGRFLELCDLFKFGRCIASADELRELHAAAIAFVLASRPETSSHPNPEGMP